MWKRLFKIAVVAFLFLTLTVGCWQGTGAINNKSNQDKDINEITLCESWGFEDGFPTIFTPGQNSNYQAAYYLANFYETLVNYQEGKIVPGLAESWSVSDNGLVYTFTLKKGVKFSDGADLMPLLLKRI